MAKKLISAEQIASIKEVLQDVTYTFFTGDVTLYVNTGAFDRWGEDNEQNDAFETYSLKGQVEFGDNISDEAKRQETGSDDAQGVTVTFNFRDLKALGLTTGNTVNVNTATDYLTYEGSKYEIDSSITDGFFDEEPVLAILSCRRVEVNT